MQPEQIEGCSCMTIETNQEDPSGNPNFNAENLEAGTGEFWGVMGSDAQRERLRMGFRVGIERSCTDNRPGYLQRQGFEAPATVRTTGGGNYQFAVATFGLTFASVHVPPSREITEGELFFLSIV